MSDDKVVFIDGGKFLCTRSMLNKINFDDYKFGLFVGYKVDGSVDVFSSSGANNEELWYAISKAKLDIEGYVF